MTEPLVKVEKETLSSGKKRPHDESNSKEKKLKSENEAMREKKLKPENDRRAECSANKIHLSKDSYSRHTSHYQQSQSLRHGH